MISHWKHIIVIFLIALTVIFLRFYQLDKIPPGIFLDEASEGYNAFSILHTGKDRYGQSFPLLFRSYWSFQTPLYTYLTIIPVYFFGNSIFSVHFISAISGVILAATSFFLLIGFEKRKKYCLSIVAIILIAISPWAVFFSRFGTEASLGVMLFAFSFLLFFLSLKRVWLFPLAAFILGLSTHAYYSERMISPLFLIGFILFFRKILFQKKKILVFGLLLFGITQIPHLILLNSGAFTKRFSQVDYFNDQFFRNSSGNLYFFPLGKQLFIIREFLSHYLVYFSPKNLFFDSDPQKLRSIPDLSVFYFWMIIPFVFGLRLLMINRFLPLIKMIILMLILAPIPASLTRDPFSTVRILIFLWGTTMTIALGVNYLLNTLSSFKYKTLIFIAVILLSLIQLYFSYFVLLKYERSENYSFSYLELLKKIELNKDQKFIVDTTRELGVGIEFVYLKKYDPFSLQKELGSRIKGQYYGDGDYEEPYIFDNIEARPIVWKKDICKKQILVGDLLAISDNQAKEHHLKFIFDVKNMAGDVTLKAYLTDPGTACSPDKAK